MELWWWFWLCSHHLKTGIRSCLPEHVMLTHGKTSMDILHHYCYFFFTTFVILKHQLKRTIWLLCISFLGWLIPTLHNFFYWVFYFALCLCQAPYCLESECETNSIDISPLANNFIWKRRPTKVSLKAQIAGVWALLYDVWSQASHFLLWRGRHLQHKASPQNCRLSGR